MARNPAAVDSDAVPPSVPPPGDGRHLAEAIAGLLKFSLVYEAGHPRVVERAKAFTTELARWVMAPWWLIVRVRNDVLWVGSQACKTDSPLVAWLATRLREAGLAGIQFGAHVEVAAAIEFARALGSCNVRCARGFATLWPPDHPSIRPLDLVFNGEHRDPGPEGEAPLPVGVPAGSHGRPLESRDPEAVAPGDAGAARHVGHVHQELVARLASSKAIAEQVQLIEAACARKLHQAIEDTTAAVDVLTLVVQQLPVEVLGDDARIEEVVTKALGAVQRDLDRLMRTDKEVLDAELMRRAMSVARRYFGKEVREIGAAKKNLPTGRPEDERITPDLDALLLELSQLPARQVLLPAASQLEASAPDMAAELGGIYLNLLIAGQRSETRTTLRQHLPKVLDALGTGRLQVFDEYLQPDRQGRVRTSDAERLSVLGVLADSGRGELIVDRDYCDPAFLARTFPGCLPALAGTLADIPRGLAMLRQGLAAVPPQRITEGAEVLSRLGALQDRQLVAALAAVGGPGVMPILRRALDAGQPALAALVVGHLRSLRLPDAEAVALRCVESAADLPLRYVADLCRMVEEQRQADAAARHQSGLILRAMLLERWQTLSQERRLLAIAGLRHVSCPESMALLSRLARTGRFTQFGKQARSVRQQARDALRWMVAKGRQS